MENWHDRTNVTESSFRGSSKRLSDKLTGIGFAHVEKVE